MPQVLWQLTPDDMKRLADQGHGWTMPDALLDWVRAHGADIDLVSAMYPLTVEQENGDRFLCYREVVEDDAGSSQIDEATGGVLTVERRVPLRADPPVLEGVQWMTSTG